MTIDHLLITAARWVQAGECEEAAKLLGNAMTQAGPRGKRRVVAMLEHFARVVVPGDSAGSRYVSSLASLTVFDGTAVPEPASIVLLLAGLGLAALMQRRAGAAG